jgi:hypothetical protein
MSGPDHSDWESDPIWNLVDQAESPEAGPFFVRNVMREVRLSEKRPARWWQLLLSPKPLLAGALGLAAVVFLINFNPGNPGNPTEPGEVAKTPAPVTPPLLDPAIEAPDSPMASTSPLEALLDEEMLFEAAEDPSAFTDEALMTMLY